MTDVLVPTGTTSTERDFSHQSTVRFRIDRLDPPEPEYFDGLSDLPALLLVEFAAMTDKLDEADIAGQAVLFRDLFSLVLTDDSSERFINRMSDKKNPISINQINDILPWIMEQYGMRPTMPSSDSLPGSESPDDGTNSTANAQPAELISAPLPATDSSTSSTQP